MKNDVLSKTTLLKCKCAYDICQHHFANSSIVFCKCFQIEPFNVEILAWQNFAMRQKPQTQNKNRFVVFAQDPPAKSFALSKNTATQNCKADRIYKNNKFGILDLCKKNKKFCLFLLHFLFIVI